MKKTTFITLIIIFGLLTAAAFITGVIAMLIFCPDMGKSKYCAKLSNYTVIEAELVDIRVSDADVEYFVLGDYPGKKYIFAVDSEDIIQRGLDDVLYQGIILTLTTIEAPSPDTYYIAALSYKGKDYIDFEKSKDAVVAVYKDIEKRAALWLSISCPILVLGIAGVIAVLAVYINGNKKAATQNNGAKK